MPKKRTKTINYSHLPDAKCIAHGCLFVAVDNVKIYKSLSHAHTGQINGSNKLYHSMSEIFTVSVDNVLLLDWKHVDSSGNYRKCLLPMPGWIYFPQNNNHSSIITRAYGVVAIQNHPLRTQQIKLEEKEEKPNCLSRCLNSRHVKKIILHFREHPWLPNLIILFIQAAIEVVIFLDIILDLIVILDLYDSPYKFTFAISCILLIAPYFIAWSVLFKFLERNYEDKKYQCLTLLFTFAPIGICILMVNDIYHLLECVFLKPIHFIVTCGRKLRSESFEELGYYKLRRVSEIFSESVLQACLQLYILLSLESSVTEEMNAKVNPVSVAAAFLSSLFIVILWITILYFESKKNGMTFVEYVTVVFQGCFKFVPYLPAIMRGKANGKRVNWIYFKIRNGSLGTIANALISPLCKLEIVKLSSYSIRSVSRIGCRYLGKLLRTSNVTLILSQKESHIKDLFDVFDITNSGSFDFDEFSRVILVMRSFRAYSTNNKLLYARIGNTINDYHQLFESKSINELEKNHRLTAAALINISPIVSADGSIATDSNSDIDKINYQSESDEKRDVYSIADKRRDEQDDRLLDDRLSRIEDIIRCDRTWTDSVTKVSIQETIESYTHLADKHHHKIWLLDLLIKVRSSVERLPCLDYDTALYYAVKSNNIDMVSLLMAYGYDKNHRQEFEHCVIESIVTQQYKMALVLCECKGIPIVVCIKRGYNIINIMNNNKHGHESTNHHRHESMNETRARSGLFVENVGFNLFVTVTVFQLTAQTDIVYSSDGSPLWNHYLLFIVPFECIDDYIYLKTNCVFKDFGEELTDNPLRFSDPNRPILSKRKKNKPKKKKKWKANRDRKYSADEVKLMNCLSTEVNVANSPKSTTSLRTPVTPPISPMGLSRNRSSEYLRSMSVYSAGNLMDNGVIEPAANHNNLFVDMHTRKFLMKFKLYHHDYNDYKTQTTKKENALCGDIELGYRNENLFNYEELVSDVKDEDDNDYKHNSYEKHFATVLNLRKRVLKRKRVAVAVDDALLDCEIYLSALKCYEKFGLEYINKNKNDFHSFDTSKYDEISKPIDSYPDYFIANEIDEYNNNDINDDDDANEWKHYKSKKKKKQKNTPNKFQNFASV